MPLARDNRGYALFDTTCISAYEIFDSYKTGPYGHAIPPTAILVSL